MARLATGIGFVGFAFGARLVLELVVPSGFWPFLMSFPAVLGAAVIGGQRAGLIATATAATIATLTFEPVGKLWIARPDHAVSVGLFVMNGALISAAIETLRRSLDRTRASEAALLESEARRRNLLDEYRHRMRNDLQSMVGLLLLRGRAAAGEEAKAALRDSAAHMLSLARIHRRMEGVVPGEAGPVLPTRAFVVELCSEIEAAQATGGFRPVALVVLAENHRIETERAVQLGLLISEAVANAYRFAFPSEAPGTICVRFWRDGGSYVLHCEDDGIGMAAGAGGGLGTRILRALSAQLRGVFLRHPGERGIGTAIEVRFPYLAAGRSLRPGEAPAPRSSGPSCDLRACEHAATPPPAA